MPLGHPPQGPCPAAATRCSQACACCAALAGRGRCWSLGRCLELCLGLSWSSAQAGAARAGEHCAVLPACLHVTRQDCCQSAAPSADQAASCTALPTCSSRRCLSCRPPACMMRTQPGRDWLVHLLPGSVNRGWQQQLCRGGAVPDWCSAWVTEQHARRQYLLHVLPAL